MASDNQQTGCVLDNRCQEGLLGAFVRPVNVRFAFDWTAEIASKIVVLRPTFQRAFQDARQFTRQLADTVSQQIVGVFDRTFAEDRRGINGEFQLSSAAEEPF